MKKNYFRTVLICILCVIVCIPSCTLTQECDHVWGDWSYNGDGTEKRVCSSCGQEETRNSSPIEYTVYQEEAAPFYSEWLSDNVIGSDAAEAETQPTFSDSAKWIWDSGTGKNRWVRFIKSVTLSEAPDSALLKIGAETKYWLYVNGEEAVFEGSLKRGATTTDGYYDVVDIAPYLKEGSNSICILVWYWGSKTENKSYSNYAVNKGGLIVDGQIGEERLVSDSTWKVCADDAYLNVSNNLTGEEQPNYRLPEYNISYDATLESDTEWKSADFDSSAWSNATVVGEYGDAPWNYLWQRPIPLIKNYGYSSYLNSGDYEGTTLARRRVLTMKVGTNVQLCPAFVIISDEAGKKITITTESTEGGQGDSVRTYYTTKAGEQEFVSLGFVNGQYVYYTIPAGVTIVSLGYYQTGYDTEKSGGFTSGNEFYDRLWQMSYDTLYVTMRDNFMDCPNRERAQWMGDVTNEMEQVVYSMDENAYLLYEKAIRQFVAFRKGSELPTVAPIGNSWFELPIQNLCTISGAWTYYQYTGRSAILEESYKAFYEYLKLWTVDSDGLVVHRPGSWDWMDNDPVNPDQAVIENAWYYRALGAVNNMALLFGDEVIAEITQSRMDVIYEAFNAQLCTEEGYYMSSTLTSPDDRGNAIAVLAGLVPEENYPAVAKVLTTFKTGSPYWEQYALEALCEMGYVDEALVRMKDRYSAMVSYKLVDGEYYSTLWEKWSIGDGTMNHAWSGSPLTVMSKYVLGVQPLTSGYNDYLIKPSCTSLTNTTGYVPTVKGQISVSFEKKSDGLVLKADLIEDANGIIAIPYYSNGAKIYIDGELSYVVGEGVTTEEQTYMGTDSNYVYFSFTGGSHEIIVE